MASYTTPKTYTNTTLTSTELNTYQRDNFNAVLPNGVTWQSFTPTINASTTNPTYGTSPIRDGYYLRIGSLVFVHFQIQFGTSMTAGSGTYRLDLPINADIATDFSDSGSFISVGTCVFRDSSGSDRYGGWVAIDPSDDTIASLYYESGSPTAAAVSTTVPFTWTDSDGMGGSFYYRCAEPT